MSDAIYIYIYIYIVAPLDLQHFSGSYFYIIYYVYYLEYNKNFSIQQHLLNTINQLFVSPANTLLFCKGIRPPPPSQRVSWYDTKQYDGEVPVMLELWEMQSTPLLASLQGPLWPGMVVNDRILFMGQIELKCVLMLNWIVWKRTVFDIETVYLC